MEKKINKLNAENIKKLDYLFELPEEVLAALDGQCPMTWELFLVCIEYCTREKSNELLARLLEEYPQYMIKYSDTLEDDEMII